MRTLSVLIAAFPLVASAQLVPLVGTPAEPAPAVAPAPTPAPAPAVAPAPPASDNDAWAPYAASSDRRAYRGGLMAISWLPAIPIGDLASKLPYATVHGFELDTRMAVHKGLTLGIDGSWQIHWNRADRQSYTYPASSSTTAPVTGAVTAQVWRYFETYQIRGTVAYHFDVKKESHLVPYVKLGFGIAANRYEISVADLWFAKYQTNFAFTADVGTLVDLKIARSFGNGLIFAVRYGLSTANFTQPALTTPMSIGFIVGGYFSF